MQTAFEDLQMVQHENALTEDDIKSALEAYDREYYNFTISDIEALTDVHIERNRRNGLTQEKHLYLARRRKEDMKAIGIPMKAAEGRPCGSGTAQEKVLAWREQHPDGRKADCHKETGLDPKTIRKWWENHNHRPCRWFAQAPLGPITSRTYRFIESSFYCMMRPTAIEIAAWRILLFVSPWLSVFLNHTLSPAFQTCSSLRSDIFSGHS